MIRKDVERILLRVQKPARYVGGELGCVIKDVSQVEVRFAFCFPDTYEIGMSHLGMKILYSLQNSLPYVWCERVFAPWVDMEALMRENGIPLYALESGDAVSEFDIVGFTLQYELSYSNVLNMLELAGIPLLARDRTALSPLVVVGGPCAFNCEPLSDFIDIAILGEGEEVNLKLIELYREYKKKGASKEEFLRAAAHIPGIYVPAFYDVEYNADGTVKSIAPNCPDAPERVEKVIIEDIDRVYYPDTFVVPNIEVVHDRVMLEIFRGCIRGCRFCQAGMIYRPVREKAPQTLCEAAKKLVRSSGYDEISLSSLSSSDYSRLPELVEGLLSWTEKEKVNLALPSLRVDNFSSELVQRIQKVRKSGLTFAPEAGTQRMRDVINKNVTHEELMNTAKTAFNGGFSSMKLYFMIGLPTETMEDVEGIASLAFDVLRVYSQCENRNKKQPASVTVSVSSFIPKPFTPFQWEAQNTREQILEKQAALRECTRSRRISLSWHDVNTSYLEGVFARGDRRLGAVLLAAHKKGCRFDSWEEQFRFDAYMEAMEECGLDPAFYTSRERGEDEIFPWEHISVGVSREFLRRERDRAYNSQTSPNCREKCLGCGAARLVGGRCEL